MKKLTAIFSLLMGILVFAACSDDDTANPYAVEKTITVDSARVLFQAAPSTGTIHVSAAKGITGVEAEKPWCQTEIDGNVVRVTVPQNTSLEGRASQIKIYSGDSYTTVTVQQMGTVVALDVTEISADNDKAQTLTYAIKHNVDVAFSTTADWIKVAATDDSLSVSLAENTTGQMRKGYIYYTTGDTTDSIAVRQYEFAKDIVGVYALYSFNQNNEVEVRATEITADSIFLTLAPNLTMGMAYTWNAAECQIEVNAAQYVGMYNQYYIYLCYRLEGGYWSGYGNKNLSFAKFDVDKKTGGQIAEVNSTVSSNAFMAWAFRAFSAQEMTAANNVGYLTTLYYPAFVKLSAGGAKPMYQPARRLALR